jgi:hypothetical protein
MEGGEATKPNELSRLDKGLLGIGVIAALFFLGGVAIRQVRDSQDRYIQATVPLSTPAHDTTPYYCRILAVGVKAETIKTLGLPTLVTGPTHIVPLGGGTDKFHTGSASYERDSYYQFSIGPGETFVASIDTPYVCAASEAALPVQP